MRARENSRARLRGGIQVGAALTIAACTLVALSPAAFAHANIISGIASCGPPTGTSFQITWSVTNDWNLPETAEVSATGGVGTLSAASLEIPASGNGSGGAGQLPYATVTTIQTLPNSVTGPISVNVSSRYSDGYRTSNIGQVAAPIDCAVTVPTTTVPTIVPPPPTAAAPAIAAAISPTTLPSATTVMAASAPVPTENKVSRSSSSANRPTLLANKLPPSKPVVPITKAATFTG
jgi:hypothetical protein